jgi:thiamine kinase-like enzyme
MNDLSVIARLQRVLAARQDAFSAVALEPLADTGLAHTHIRLAGTGALARLPKQSQLGLDAAQNLTYQAACYIRAAEGGHAPRLIAVIAPGEDLPRGGLIVEEIIGRAAHLPEDLPAIAEALAALHGLASPPPDARPPIMDSADPLQALAEEIAAQAGFLDGAGLEAESRRVIERNLAAFHALCAADARPAKRLIAFDAHPGNFIIRQDGRAVLVDLEKCRYSAPPLDLAHATLYTSTTWDVASSAELSVAEVAGFYSRWSHGGGVEFAPWFVPLRRAMWLWSVTWCAKWRVLSEEAAQTGSGGEDWSADKSSDALVRHVRGRVDCYLSPAIVERVDAEFQALNGLLDG